MFYIIYCLDIATHGNASNCLSLSIPDSGCMYSCILLIIIVSNFEIIIIANEYHNNQFVPNENYVNL